MKFTVLRWFIAYISFMVSLSAQWDIRVEIPSAKSSNLPNVLLAGSTALQKGEFDMGKGYIITGSKAIFDVGLLSFDGSLEYSEFKASGTMTQAQRLLASQVKQQGVGLGLNAMVWAPFVGVAGEFGLIHRFQSYDIVLDTASKSKTFGRTWMRIGARYRIPFVPFDAYVTASWQQPLSPDKPVVINSAQSLVDLLNTQGTGQEFNRLWTFGVGVRY